MPTVGGRTATFVLGDVVSSTRQWTDAPEKMRDRIARLEALVSDLATAHDGELAAEQGEGDSFVVAFTRATDAVTFALELQRSLGTEDDDLRVRTAIHSGDAEVTDGRWRGSTLNRSGRLRDLAHGGQIILSAATAALVVDHLPDGATLRDLGRHRLRDLARPEEVRQLCHQDLIAEFPLLSSVDRYPNNLPVELTSFIGRETELAAIANVLSRSRLVTLTGAGGAGKTRLALHAAARHLDAMPEGVWLADLSSTADPAMVPKTLGAACGLPESAFQSMTDTIVNHFGDESALVVLDNCEHLLDACAELAARLLAACPNVSVVATSREPLGTAGEAVYRVPALALPANNADIKCESVQLFVERARAVRDSFTLDDVTRPAVTALCRALDGLPLAIELAASRCRAMSPVEIAAQLSDRFRILSAGRRAALPRQRTLEASVQWSYELLDDDERTLLRRLAVFAGGFTVEGAEAVGASNTVDRWKVVDLLTNLVDKSLVQVEDVAGFTRYGLLETIRIFAALRLDEAGELPATRAAHLAHMVAVAEVLDPSRSQSSFEDTVAAFLADIDNFRSALDYSIETTNGGAATRILAALGILFGNASTLECTRYVAAIEPIMAGDPMTCGRAIFEGAAYGLVGGDADIAQLAASSLDRLHGETAHPGVEAMAQYFRARLLLIDGDPRGIDLLRTVADTFAARGEVWLLQYVHDELVTELLWVGRVREARCLADEAAELDARSGNPYLTRYGTIGAGVVASAEGRFDDADRTWLRFGAAAAGWAPFISSVSEPLLALSRSAAGDHEAACEISNSALDRARRYALAMPIALGGYLRHWLWLRAGRDLDESELDEAAAVMEAIGAPWGVVIVESFRAEVRLGRGDLVGAAECSVSAVTHARSSTFARHGHPRACRTGARVALARGDGEAAESLAHESLTSYAEMTQRWGVAEALETLAHVLREREEAADAARLLGGADRIRREVAWTVAVPEEAELATLRQHLIEELGSDAFQAAFSEGAALTDDGLVVFAQRGRGSRKRPKSGWSSLTPTENEVVQLLGDGLRNRDIAQKLFMSEATVRTHLTHIFAKLGMSGRGEVIAAMRTKLESS